MLAVPASSAASVRVRGARPASGIAPLGAAAAPVAPLLPALNEPVSSSSLTEPPLVPNLELPSWTGKEAKNVVAEVGGAIREHWEALETQDSGLQFVRERGVEIKLGVPTKRTPGHWIGLADDEKLRIKLNWTYIVRDIAALKTLGLPQEEAISAVGRSLVPVVEHEALHLRLRADGPGYFPDTVEEEFLTHSHHARVFERQAAMREEPEAVRKGSILWWSSNQTQQSYSLGAAALYASLREQLHANHYSLIDPVEFNVGRAVATLQGMSEDPKAHPKSHFVQLAQDVAFWSDPLRVAEFADYITGLMRGEGLVVQTGP